MCHHVVAIYYLQRYRNGIMFCANLTFANFMSADGHRKEKIVIIKLVRVALGRRG